jgi:hypothetical protein
VPAHIVPVMLIVIYAAPGAFGRYVFQDRYATLFLCGLVLSIVAYYAGYWVVRGGRTHLKWHVPAGTWRPTARSLEVAGLAIVAMHLLLVLYLALTAERLALFAALGLGSAGDIALARETFVQSRTGGERVLVYLHTITFRAVLPVIVVFLYMRRNRWRHAILAVLLFTSLLSLEKSLPLFLLVPLLTYFLLANQANVAGRLLLLAGAALGLAIVLATGVLGGGPSRDDVPLVTNSPDRKNLFWVISQLRGVSQSDLPNITQPSGALDRPAHQADAAWAALRLRNRIVNGDMQIDRISRGTLMDRRGRILDNWFSNVSVNGKLAHQRVAEAPPGFAYSITISVANAYTPKAEEVFELHHTIEGFKVRDLAFGTADAQDVSVSFWVKASVPGTYNLTIGNGSFTRHRLMTYSIVAADRWEHKVVTLPGDTHGGAKLGPRHSADSIVLSFNFGAGTAWRTRVTDSWRPGFARQSTDGVVSLVENQGATLQMTGVQLEAGRSATPFEHRTDETVLDSIVRFALDDAFSRSALFMLNRLLWTPYITAYDWFRYQDEILQGDYLRGKTAGPLAWLQGEPRFSAEKEIFKYQFGQSATPTGTANAVFFADAYLNFGWLGILVCSVLLGVIFGLITALDSLSVASVSVMSSFGVMVASFTANLFSGGLLILLLLAFMSRGIRAPTEATHGDASHALS